MADPSYRWASGPGHGQGFDPRGVSVGAVVAALERVKAAKGMPSAKDVVQAARPAASPLHRFFEWDDAVAAERHRARQARELLSCIVVMREAGDRVREGLYVVEFFGRSGSGGKGSRTLEIQRSESAPAPEIGRTAFSGRGARSVPEQAWDELLAWQARFGDLPIFAEVKTAITRARNKASEAA